MVQVEEVGGLHKDGGSGMNDRTKGKNIRRQDLVIECMREMREKKVLRMMSLSVRASWVEWW